IEVASPIGTSRHLVEFKTGVTQKGLNFTISQLRALQEETGLKPILYAPYISPDISEELLKDDINYIDDAGNVFLTSHAVHILVTGKKSTWRPSRGGLTSTDL